ncbi:MAG: UDP-N-acetylmuramoyl-L-alanyl-D-glutamate--2,6-diaminopimelate ligase [Puniceicoccales bacterium]|nr:UDP-N-acetylmuramoyl-L-alanyl-D-glutamate--2,6-diaminopimelate ligase [Puniceicoccales bacterium]
MSGPGPVRPWGEIFFDFPGHFPFSTPVAAPVDDDRRLGPRDGIGLRVFFARRGVGDDGHRHIPSALARGVDALVVDADWPGSAAVPTLRVADVREFWSLVWSRWHGNPDGRLAVHAVTGTNGKTTFVWALQHLLGPESCGRLSTVDPCEDPFGAGPVPPTTPSAPAVHGALAAAVAAGKDHFALEISSHALDQKRLWGLRLASATFTNLGHDHLDYHGTVEEYFDAKCRLFDGRGGPVPEICSVGGTTPQGRRLRELLLAKKIPVQSFGTDDGCDWQLLQWKPDGDGMDLCLRAGGEIRALRLSLLGEWNALNLLAALAIAARHRPLDQLCERLRSFSPPPGRMERLCLPGGALALIDYAHTPDALRAALECLRRHFPRGRIILVFGCGGERDRQKRPAMAAVAEEFSDFSIVTNDNPRGESPDAIAAEICSGFCKNFHRTVLDRRAAIALGIRLARRLGRDGILLVAGKGHEHGMEMGGKIFPFQDRRCLEDGGAHG